MRKKIGFLALLSVLVLPISISAKTLDKDITLTEDVNDGILVESGKQVTLNLGGKKITNKDGEHTIMVESGATLTIVGEGSATNTSNDRAVLSNDGTLIIKGGTYSRVETKTPDVTYYVFLNHGTATIDGGTFKIDSEGVEKPSSLITNGWYTPSDNKTGNMSSLTINNGEFLIENNDKYIKNDDFGIMTINGGTFTMKKPSSAVIGHMGYASGKEKVTINGGTFNYTGTNYAIWDNPGKKAVIINGGIYNLTDANGKISNVEFNKETSEEFTISGSNTTVIVKKEDIKEIVKINGYNTSEVLNQPDIEAIKDFAAKKYELASFYEINLYKGLDEDTIFEGTEIEESDSTKVITLKIPTSLKAVQDGYKRTYYIIRSHMVDDKYEVDVLDTTLNEDGTVSFKTDKFSSYALAYIDKKVEKAEVKNPNTADNGLLYIILSGLGLVSIAFVSKSLIKH